MTQPPKRAATFTTAPWVPTWARTAGVGALFLVLLFVWYEVAERLWFKELFSTEVLFRFHIYRGVGASIILASWSFYSIWRTRQRFDQAFRTAYETLAAEHEARTQALARQQAFTERLFDALRDWLVVIDRNGRVVKANRIALDQIGSESVGRQCGMMGHACAPGGAGCVAMKALHAGHPIVGEVVRTDPRSGRIYAVDAYPVPDPESGNDVVIEAARDITDARQLEARVRSQEKLAALGVLAAGIAHDIGNPLASMSSELELLESEEDMGRVRASLTVLTKQIGRISRTLREMTDFARRRGDERSLVSIGVAVEDALRMVRHDPRARRVAIETEISPGLPELRMVEDHLVMVLVNLVINAFDAMPAGGKLKLAARQQGHDVLLSVGDTGVGMTAEVRQRAVEALFTTKPGGTGTGLGLTVSADWVRSVGGSLEIDSALGTGTQVTLRFPAAAALAEPKVAHG